MNIEEAVEIQKNIRQKILDGKRIREGAYLYWQIEQSIEIVLNELDKKDKIIDMMAERISTHNKIINDEYGTVDKNMMNKEKIKDYFYNKLESN